MRLQEEFQRLIAVRVLIKSFKTTELLHKKYQKGYFPFTTQTDRQTQTFLRTTQNDFKLCSVNVTKFFLFLILFLKNIYLHVSVTA